MKLKNYFSKTVTCDICNTEFDHDEFLIRLASNTSNTHYVCKSCNADYKHSNILVWPAAIVTSIILQSILSNFFSIDSLKQLGILLLSFAIANSFRQYLSFFKLVKESK